MKKAILIFVLLALGNSSANSWGFWAHKRINRIAVFTLPPEMFGFYKQNIEFITEHAIDPDKRRYVSKMEAPRHFIDIDHYGEYPFEMVPRRWFDAVDKYSEDTLQAYGIVPWHIYRMMTWLTSAFKEKNEKKILQLSADIGHYIGDAHVPLHTTINYNGQLTGQKGIHGFWETRLPELFGEDYDYFVGKASYIKQPLDLIWEMILQSAAAKDSVLLFEKQLTDEYPADKKYGFGTQGQQTYSREFSAEYHRRLNGMVERRMRSAILNVGNIWMTCWVNAGQPNLGDYKTVQITEEDQKAFDKIDDDFQKGKIHGREHDH